LPELPEVEAWRRQLDPLVKKFPIEKAGPAHIATLKTFDPPMSALDNEGFKGVERRAKRFLLPTDDDELVLMVHLMSAGRLKYVPPNGQGAKTPMFRVRFPDGGELKLPDAGSQKRAGRWPLRPDALGRELAHLGPGADEIDAERWVVPGLQARHTTDSLRSPARAGAVGRATIYRHADDGHAARYLQHA